MVVITLFIVVIQQLSVVYAGFTGNVTVDLYF
jgi:hypothetical protein